MNKFMKITLAALLAAAMAVPAAAEPIEENPVPTEAPALTEPAVPVATTVPTVTNRTSRVSFSDINTPELAWAKPYVTDMAEKGYIKGYEDGTYRPEQDVTRLEDFSLFARVMGSNDAANEKVLEIAHDRYDSIIKNYNLTWGSDEIAYLMYKGAIKKTDLDTYIAGEEKNTPMKRYEAAIIITKALGGEEKALSDPGVILTYNDAREVPSNAIQYVAYATDAGIMTGMGDGEFSPNTSVKRSQIAVMLSKTVDQTKYSFEKVKLTKLDTETRTITVLDADGEEKEYVYTDDTMLRNLGDDVQPKELYTNVDAVITLSDGNLTSVEVIANEPDRTVSGKYVSYASTSGKTTIRVTLDDTEETESFEVDPDVSVTYEGSPATVRSFTRGDYVTLHLQNGKVVKITGDTKTVTITGAVVENVDITNGVKITISHGDEAYNGQTYAVSDNVSVKKNNTAVGLDQIYKGDKVTLELEYGIITKITATSSSKTVQGPIKSLTISTPDSTMTVTVDGEERVYTVPKDVTITINGEEGTLYDFRVGDVVKISTESDAITKIVATSTQESAGSVTGVVTAVNTSFGFIDVQPEGALEPTKVFCKDDTTTFMTLARKTVKMKDIKVGQTIEVKGTVSNGAFVGTIVLVLAQ